MKRIAIIIMLGLLLTAVVILLPACNVPDHAGEEPEATETPLPAPAAEVIRADDEGPQDAATQTPEAGAAADVPETPDSGPAGGDGVADGGDPESGFPREMALRAAVVAMTNGVATDVFKDDGSTFNLSNFHSYSDLSGFHLLVVDEGSWSAKDERTWRVEGLKCSMSEGDKFLKASMDVTFDGANYVVLNVERTIAKEADLDSGDPAKAPVETLRFSSENPFLMVTPRLIEMGR